MLTWPSWTGAVRPWPLLTGSVLARPMLSRPAGLPVARRSVTHLPRPHRPLPGPASLGAAEPSTRTAVSSRVRGRAVLRGSLTVPVAARGVRIRAGLWLMRLSARLVLPRSLAVLSRSEVAGPVLPRPRGVLSLTMLSLTVLAWLVLA